MKFLTQVIADNPYAGKKLLGDLDGSYSFRLTYKDRIVYSLDETKKLSTSNGQELATE